MPHHALTRYHDLGLDLHSARYPRQHNSQSITIHTERGTHKLSLRTISKYLPGLYRSLSSDGPGYQRHGRYTLDFTQERQYATDFDQKCLYLLFDYLEDLEVRGGSSSLLFDRLVKALNHSRSDYGRHSPYGMNSHYLPVTLMFGVLGAYFEDHRFGHNSTIFAAMEAFFVHRSRELCQLPPAEIMTYVYALDAMHGSMTSTLASLKAGLGHGRRMQDLLDHCRLEFDSLSPRTLNGFEQMLGESLSRCGGGISRDDRLYMPARHGGRRWNDLPGLDDHRSHRYAQRGGQLILSSLVQIHAKVFRDAYTYTSSDAHPEHVWAIPLRYGHGGSAGGSRMGARHYDHHPHRPLPHHHHHLVRDVRDRDRLDDEVFYRRDALERYDDGLARSHLHGGRLTRSPRRRSISSDSDDASLGMRRYGDYDY